MGCTAEETSVGRGIGRSHINYSSLHWPRQPAAVNAVNHLFLATRVILVPPGEILFRNRSKTAPRTLQDAPGHHDSLIQVYFADFPLPFLYIPPLCFNVIPNVLCLPYSSFIRNLMWLPHPT